MVIIVYMVAGLSSRFGGKIKQFARVGLNGETLIEVSMKQAIKAGAKKIVFVASEKTKIPFKEKFGNSFENTPIFYSEQFFDKEKRDKPWGSTDALVSAKENIDDDFIVLNGDDLYGENAIKSVVDFLENSDKNEGVTIGYKLKKVLPEKGKTNRGIFKTNENSEVIQIKEILEIEKDKLEEKELNENDLTSMNIFGLPKKILTNIEEKLIEFKEKNKDDKKIECYLPVILSELISEKKLVLKLLKTNDKWFGVTNPEDEEIVREELKKYYKKDFYEC